MKKTQHTILLKPVSPTNNIEFFQRIFYRFPSLIEPAQRVYGLVKSGRINELKYTETLRELNLKKGQYYSILRTLLALGIVEKRMGEDYKLSSDFALRLHALGSYAETLRSK